MGSVTKEMENYKTAIRRERLEIHRDQAIMERFNRTLAECLFGHQYAVEMLHPEKRSTLLPLLTAKSFFLSKKKPLSQSITFIRLTKRCLS